MNFYDVVAANSAEAFSSCVGVDPTPAILHAWGLDDTAAGAQQFALRMLEATDGLAKIVKPQAAYFERFGVAGYQALSEVIQEAKRMGLLVLADVKRSDIGSTVDAYSSAWLGESAPLQVDAITVVPYFGLAALEPMFRRAADAGAYVFVVLRSSNPEGKRLQEHGHPYLWHTLLDDMRNWEQKNDSITIGAVVGATAPDALRYATNALSRACLLVPGIGAQGGKMSDIENITNEKNRLIVTASRSLAELGPDVSNIKNAIRRKLVEPCGEQCQKDSP